VDDRSDDSFLDPLDWPYGDEEDPPLLLLKAAEEEVKVARAKYKGNRELLNLKSSVSYGFQSAKKSSSTGVPFRFWVWCSPCGVVSFYGSFWQLMCWVVGYYGSIWVFMNLFWVPWVLCCLFVFFVFFCLLFFF
jgi:hypothetical protein